MIDLVDGAPISDQFNGKPMSEPPDSDLGVRREAPGVGASDREAMWAHPIHHIASDKSSAWTPQFSKFFNKAHMSISKDPCNLLELRGHQGPHPQEYHMWVWLRLAAATDGKSGKAYATALRSELDRISDEILKNPMLVEPSGRIWR
jgi:A nuclease family of the HNH/ENDO VII superfamily with conserved AHH